MQFNSQQSLKKRLQTKVIGADAEEVRLRRQKIKAWVTNGIIRGKHKRLIRTCCGVILSRIQSLSMTTTETCRRSGTLQCHRSCHSTYASDVGVHPRTIAVFPASASRQVYPHASRIRYSQIILPDRSHSDVAECNICGRV